MRFSNKIAYMDNRYIITKGGTYYKRCVGNRGSNTIECSYTRDDGYSYWYETFYKKSGGQWLSRHYTVAKVPEEKLSIAQKRKIINEVL